MVRRTYYLPHEVVVGLDRAVVEAQASAYGDRAPDKSTVVTAVIRAGLAAMPAVITELRSSGRAVAKGLPLEAAAGRSGRARPVAVPDDLAELTGPTNGVVQLTVGVHSSGLGPAERFDLARESARIAMYEIVLTEGRIDDLRKYLDAGELRRLWSRLWLPMHVRSAWHQRFPALGFPALES